MLAHTLAAYSERNQKLILSQCPHASDVRGFRASIEAGRVVRKGQNRIRVVNIRPAHVFDVSQTDPLPGAAVAA